MRKTVLRLSLVIVLFTGCAAGQLQRLKENTDLITQSVFPKFRRYMAADEKLAPEDKQTFDDAMDVLEKHLKSLEEE